MSLVVGAGGVESARKGEDVCDIEGYGSPGWPQP